MPSPTKLGAIVTHNSLLRQLFREARENRSHSEGIKDNTLILIADSSAWASKLRYQVATIQRRMEAAPEFARVRNIRVKVAAAEPTTQVPVRRAQALSATTAEGIRKQAESIEDPLLREAILKLTSHRPRGGR